MRAIIFTLTADNRLLALRVADGMIIADRRLAPAPPAGILLRGHGSGRHSLALARDGRRLFVLVPGFLDRADAVAVIDTTDFATTATYPLAGSGLFQSLAVGPATGRLYLFGYQQPASGLVTILDPDGGETVTAWTVGRATDMPYQIGVSDDERRMFLAYTVSGLDWYDVADGGLRHCEGKTLALRGCLRTHGAFSVAGDGMLAASGGRVIVALGLDGTLRRGFDTGLAESHIAEFVVDTAARRLYALGSCDEGGGFSALDLAGGGIPATSTYAAEQDWRWHSPPSAPLVQIARQPTAVGTSTVCGERLALGPGGLLAIAKTTPATGAATATGSVLLLDGESGQVRHVIPTGSDPIDVLVSASP